MVGETIEVGYRAGECFMNATVLANAEGGCVSAEGPDVAQAASHFALQPLGQASHQSVQLSAGRRAEDHGASQGCLVLQVSGGAWVFLFLTICR